MAGKKSSGGWGGALLLAAVILGGLLYLHYAHGMNGPDLGNLPRLPHLSSLGTEHHGGYVAPVAGATVTSGYGARWGAMHGGIDLAADTGTPIRAITASRVIEAGPATGFGLWMRLRHDRTGDVSVYGHMNTIDRPAGAHVAAGERIATVGARGEATGPHLHLEIWPHGDRAARLDPAPWLATRGVRL